jgi:AGZA family xanthine/uracil permease-like MFS transporter
MHGEMIGVAQTPTVAVSYLAVTFILLACAKFAVVAPKPAEAHHGEEEESSPDLVPAPAE